MAHSFDAAVVIGRFQPFHKGHLALVEEALRVAPRVFVVVGSAFAARSPRNPWTHEERARLILAAVDERQRSRVHIVPMRDYFDEPRWRRNLVAKVNTLAGNDARIAVVGHFKDSSSGYLEGFERWGLVRVPLLGDIHATPLRRAYFQSEGDAALAWKLPPLVQALPVTTVEWLEEFRGNPAFLALAEEQRALVAYREAWKAAPFPPVFVTVDAVVTCQQHVLLIQRGKPPGKGLWALPGGFIDLDETLLQSALRELVEETGLVLKGSSAVPNAAHVFDHPARSQRGRTISHAFHFELPATRLPLTTSRLDASGVSATESSGVFAAGNGPAPSSTSEGVELDYTNVVLCAADDAADLAWVPCSELRERESDFFDDHFHVLDTFFGLLED